MDEALEQTLAEWITDFDTRQDKKSNPLTRRSVYVLKKSTEGITKWISANNKTPPQLKHHLDDAEEFLDELDIALHPKNSPFANEKSYLWRHCDFNFYRSSKASHLDSFVDQSELKHLATKYLQKPWLQNSYLDWVFIDAMSASEIASSIGFFRRNRFGMSYAMFDGSRWKMVIWKLIMTPISILVGWILPLVGLYYLYPWSFWLAVGLGIAYYGFSFWILFRRLWAKLYHLITRKPTPLRKLEDLITEMGKTYSLLAGPIIHIASVRNSFDKSMELGVGWDQQTFYILDQLAERRPTIWSTSL